VINSITLPNDFIQMFIDSLAIPKKKKIHIYKVQKNTERCE